jgi:thiol-disulfide isomerase/thioredoxin
VKFLILIAAAGVAMAQTSPDACEVPSDLRDFYNAMKASPRRVDLLRERLAQDPGNLFLNRWYLESPRLRPGALADEYRTQLDKHPGDAPYLYFYGRALMGLDTRQAIRYLDQALQRDPKLPAVYQALTEIYASPTFKDSAKLGDAMLKYTGLCEDPDGFAHLRDVDQPAAIRELAARLRRRIESSNTTMLYRNLWAAEFRSADPVEFDRLRSRVAEDMKRIKQLDPENTNALIEGYKLIGDSDSAGALAAKVAADPRPKSFNEVLNRWFKEHPFPSQPDQAEYYAQRLMSARQWVKDWPDVPNAQYWLVHSLAEVKGAKDEELISAGEDLLDRDPRESPLSEPAALTVARVWSQRNIRLADCARLADDALATIERGEDWDNDMRRPPLDTARDEAVAREITEGRFSALETKADIHRRLGHFEVTHATLAQVRSLLDQKIPDVAPYREFEYWYSSGQLAQVEGHKLDALAYYQKSLGLPGRRKEIRAHIEEIWNSLGGSTEVLRAFYATAEPPKPAAPKATVATDITDWTALNLPLTQMKAEDLAGKSWTVANLQGKTTLINVWATWCEPCRRELPQLQKLYDQTRDRQDVQVITIAIDENPGLIAPFLAQNHYTFPVVLAKALVDQLMPSISIPRNWIVDTAGVLRWESFGFDDRVADWHGQMLEKLAVKH